MAITDCAGRVALRIGDGEDKLSWDFVMSTTKFPVDPAGPLVASLPDYKWNIVTRIRRKLRRMARVWCWRSRMKHFGRRSYIDNPEMVIGTQYIHIGDGVGIWPHARIEAQATTLGDPLLEIGDGTQIQPHLMVAAMRAVRIGKGVLMASYVYITDHDHYWEDPETPPVRNPKVIVAPVRIGDYVWLGQRVMVLKGVEIGAHSIIGAGSIVTRSIPPYSVAVGAPAKVVRRYDAARKEWMAV